MGIAPEFHKKSIAGLLTRAQPWEAGSAGTSV
jgi:hypothetical protein